MIALTPLQRFHAKWELDPKTGCWLWTANRDKDGYGIMWAGKHWLGFDDNIRASRAAWVLFKGEIPDGMFACHRCDNPPCVNPEHLFLGTAKDNARDMIGKGRQLHGSDYRRSSLVESDIPVIRASCETGPTLAARYGVDVSTIWEIRHRKKWKHVA